MTHEDKKAWLGRYRDGQSKIEKLKEQRARAKSFGEKVTVSYSGRQGNGRADKVQLSVERVAQIDAEIAEIRAGMPLWEKETTIALQSIQNPEYRRVMRYYYIECLSWADTAELAGFGNRYLRDLHRRLLDDLDL